MPDHIDEDGVELFEACLERGLEGVVATQPSPAGQATAQPALGLAGSALESDDLGELNGWTGENPFDALVVGYHEDGRLLPCGTVGGGYDEAAIRAVGDALVALASEVSPLEPPPIMTNLQFG